MLPTTSMILNCGMYTVCYKGKYASLLFTYVRVFRERFQFCLQRDLISCICANKTAGSGYSSRRSCCCLGWRSGAHKKLIEFNKKCKKEQPQAPGCAAGHPAGKQRGRTGPGHPGGRQLEHEPAMCPCCKEV